MPLTDNEQKSITSGEILSEVKKTLSTRSTLWLEEKFYSFNETAIAVAEIIKAKNKVFPAQLTVENIKKLEFTVEELNCILMLIIIGKDFTSNGQKFMVILLELGADANLLQLLNVLMGLKNRLIHEAFSQQLPQAAMSLHIYDAYITYVNNQPLMHWVLDTNDFHMVNAALFVGAKITDLNDDGLPYLHCLSNWDHPDNLKRKIRFLIDPKREFFNSNIPGMELNLVFREATALERAASTLKTNVVDALLEISQEFNKNVFRADQPSLWPLTVQSGMSDTVGDETSVKLIRHALVMNERKPPQEQADVFLPAAFAQRTAKFLLLALHKSWPLTFDFILQHRPQWLHCKFHGVALIDSIVDSLHVWNDYEILWIATLHRAKLSPKVSKNDTPLKKISDTVDRSQTLLFLPCAPYQANTLLARLAQREYEKKQLPRPVKKQKSEEPLWATQARRVQNVFKQHSGVVFFKTIQDKSYDIRYNMFIISSIVIRATLEFINKKNANKPEAQKQFFSPRLVLLMFSFMDLSVLSLDYNNKDEKKQIDEIILRKKDHTEFVRHVIPPLVAQASIRCRAKLYHEVKPIEAPKREMVRAKRRGGKG